MTAYADVWEAIATQRRAKEDLTIASRRGIVETIEQGLTGQLDCRFALGALRFRQFKSGWHVLGERRGGNDQILA